MVTHTGIEKPGPCGGDSRTGHQKYSLVFDADAPEIREFFLSLFLHTTILPHLR